MDYAEALTNFRRRKDEHFAAGRGPIQGEALAAFRGLNYYPPDWAWAFELPLEPPAPDSLPEFPLQTSTGTVRHMALLGRVSLPLPGGPFLLSVFAPLGEENPARVFIPFRDATSGPETYGAGRYLDAPVAYEGDETRVTVDFNLAYHPYCAYGDDWTCPLPPAENVLPVAVRAGEKLMMDDGKES